MNELDDVFELAPYESSRKEKQRLLVEHLNELKRHHRERCEPYRKVLDAFGSLFLVFGVGALGADDANDEESRWTGRQSLPSHRDQ